MTDKQKQPAANGLIFKNGQWHIQCGSTDYPVKLQDANGQPVPPPVMQEIKVSSSQ